MVSLNDGAIVEGEIIFIYGIAVKLYLQGGMIAFYFTKVPDNTIRIQIRRFCNACVLVKSSSGIIEPDEIGGKMEKNIVQIRRAAVTLGVIIQRETKSLVGKRNVFQKYTVAKKQIHMRMVKNTIFI